MMQSWMNAGARMMEISLRASGSVKSAIEGVRQEAEKAASSKK
jgi:hypothetical protein